MMANVNKPKLPLTVGISIVCGINSHGYARIDNHVNYWNPRMAKNEHRRFEMGFLQGWNDGKLFFSFPGNSSLSEIGYMAEWKKRRVAEHVAAKGGGEFVWEFGKYHTPSEH